MLGICDSCLPCGLYTFSHVSSILMVAIMIMIFLMYNKMRMLYGGEDKLEVCQNVAECIGKCKGGGDILY